MLLRVIRDGVVESVHRGWAVVAGPDGETHASVGDPGHLVFARSSLKPFQAVAVLEQLEDAGVWLDLDGLAIATASHDGSDDHQIEAARLLAMADLDEAALATPPALPSAPLAPRACAEPTSLAHNCSGKHAAFLWAQVAAGRPPSGYLDPDGELQLRVRAAVERITGCAMQGMGIDGCGAPAWRLPLAGLATGFARLAQGTDARLRRVRAAMTGRPDLVGGFSLPDTALMLADPRVVAKRGAEAVFGAGFVTDDAAYGIAIKVEDGGNRAAGPVTAAVLEGMGASVPAEIRTPVVLGGGQPRGIAEVDAAVAALGRSA